jgi:hypothetical protein
MNLSPLKQRTRVQIQQLVAEFVSLSNTMLKPLYCLPRRQTHPPTRPWGTDVLLQSSQRVS